MKHKHLLLAGALLTAAAQGLKAQNHFPNQGGNCGINTFNIQNPPNFNLQIHGTTTWTPPPVLISDGESSEGSVGSVPINYGYTSRFGMTNTVTGKLSSDGIEFRMSEKNFSLTNQENGGNIFIGTIGSSLLLDAANKRIYAGAFYAPTPDLNLGKFNVNGENGNGLHIRTNGSGKYGLAVRMGSSGDNAIQVLDQLNNRNFLVKASGEVYARKYTTTLLDIPDYVFEPSYKLLTFDELRLYIETNRHLPNIPSAAEIKANNDQVDLGEMNRLLLEKVEEMSLYILQLEERLKKLEEKQ